LDKERGSSFIAKHELCQLLPRMETGSHQTCFSLPNKIYMFK
jgi:hypothetical protein